MSTNQQTNQEPTGLTINQASRVLDISENAIRQRIKRGTIPAKKVDGIWRVQAEDHEANQQDGKETGQPETPTATTIDQSAYIEHLENENARLWSQVESQNDSERELRLIIARVTDRIPELSAASEPPQSTQPPPSPDDGTTSTPDDPGHPEPSGSAWRRFVRFLIGE